MPIILVTGGARSGKSTYAEKYCKEIANCVTYIACGKITDDEMAHRIKKHKEQRPSKWVTIEQYKDFENIANANDNKVFLLDCITTMITNIIFDFDLDYDTCSQDEIEEVESTVQKEIDDLIISFKCSDKTLVAVTNEVGLGLVPSYRLGRIFRDIAGRINQHIASEADEVYCLISGLSMKIK